MIMEKIFPENQITIKIINMAGSTNETKLTYKIILSPTINVEIEKDITNTII